jgi:anthranilate phosphoribosyltransferase
MALLSGAIVMQKKLPRLKKSTKQQGIMFIFAELFHCLPDYRSMR